MTQIKFKDIIVNRLTHNKIADQLSEVDNIKLISLGYGISIRCFTKLAYDKVSETIMINELKKLNQI